MSHPRVVFQDTTFIPKNLLERERAAEIFDMLDAGVPLEEIYKDQRDYMISRCATRPTRQQARNRVDTLILNKWRYCPDIDEVAVERAYDGDRAAWLALTHYERQIVIDRLYELWQSGNNHRMWPDDQFGGVGSWANSVGEDKHRVTGLRKGPDGLRRRSPA